MKNGMKLGLAVVTLMSVSAFADFRPGRVRAVAKIQLEQIENDGLYPQAEQLLVNKADGKPQIVGFTLIEDTGLRCVTTPCPSSKTTHFYVTNISKKKSGSIVYTASTTRPLLTGIVVPGKDAREIEVADHSNNKSARYKFPWILSIEGESDTNTYGGHLEHLMVTQGVGGLNVE